MADDAGSNEFDLRDFLPYLLSQAADALSLEFQKHYRERYGMLRTEWRVLFHLGRYGAMSARDICRLAHIHKTKVSRAVVALEQKRYLSRSSVEEDRRRAILRLTEQGETVYLDLSAAAQAFDTAVRETMTDEEATVLYRCLRRLSGADSVRPTP